MIYRNGRANALMVSRHGDALAAQAVTDVLEDAWHEGSAERTLDLYGPPRRTLQVRARQIDDARGIGIITPLHLAVTDVAAVRIFLGRTEDVKMRIAGIRRRCKRRLETGIRIVFGPLVHGPVMRPG